MRAPSVHLTGKIVGHVLETAYPTGQPGSFSSEIADLLRQLETVPGQSGFVKQSSAERLADIIAREQRNNGR
jgi:hypothetical protein